MTSAEVSGRRPVWYALSELYLDTELGDRDLRTKAAMLARSPYSVAELRDIELWDVAPVVLRNMMSIAGEWAGFNESWIYAECEKRARRRSLLLRLAVACGFGLLVRWATARYWSQLGAMITAARLGTHQGRGVCIIGARPDQTLFGQ
jgi:hypothetical protein